MGRLNDRVFDRGDHYRDNRLVYSLQAMSHGDRRCDIAAIITVIVAATVASCIHYTQLVVAIVAPLHRSPRVNTALDSRKHFTHTVLTCIRCSYGRRQDRDGRLD